MGRMADARKRARRGRPPEPPEQPQAGPTPQAAPAHPAPPQALVFPADPAADAPAGRIALPSSGLAEEILARADAGALVAPLTQASLSEPAEAVSPASPAEASRAHNISFFAAPTREERAVEAQEHLASFFLAREEYAVDVRLVQEIIRVTEITQVPRAPDFIKGVINLRGRIIPVVDLKRKLGLGEVVLPSRVARIVVVKVRERMIGLLVDGASQVLKVAVSCIEPAPEEVVEIDQNYIRGVAKLQDRLIILVDLQKILALELKEGALTSP